MELQDAILTQHALELMALRQISEDTVLDVLFTPEQVLPDRPGRVVAQSIRGGYLLRVFVDVDRDPPEVVTAYRTSNIAKYWSQS